MGRRGTPTVKDEFELEAKPRSRNSFLMQCCINYGVDDARDANPASEGLSF